MSFSKLNIDYVAEYEKARNFMCTKGTDLDRLAEVVGLLYLQEHNTHQVAYRSLLEEISTRRAMMEMQPLRDLQQSMKELCHELENQRGK